MDEKTVSRLQTNEGLINVKIIRLKSNVLMIRTKNLSQSFPNLVSGPHVRLLDKQMESQENC